MQDVLVSLGRFIRSHGNEACVGISAVVLMLVGPRITHWFLSVVKSLHWIVRYVLVILLITAGFGTLSNIIFRVSKRYLMELNNTELVFWTLAVFLLLGLVARNEKKI
jgi:hypothetical protein